MKANKFDVNLTFEVKFSSTVTASTKERALWRAIGLAENALYEGATTSFWLTEKTAKLKEGE